MNKMKIAILFGGCSEEHPVSIKSAREIARNLDKQKYDPIYVGITKEGTWLTCDEPCESWQTEHSLQAILSPDRAHHGLLLLHEGQYRIIRLDVVFPVLHGKLGEDGAIQGLLELSAIPYVGCDISSSVLGMDKALAHMAAKSVGIDVPRSMVLNYQSVHYDAQNFNPLDEYVRDFADQDPDGQEVDNMIGAAGLSYPVFVKPARSGSSFGVSKVLGKEDLMDAIRNARQYDKKVLIEETIIGCEVGCAVLGNGSDLIAGEVDQIALSSGFFRIHQEVKPEGGSENATIQVPALIPEETRRRIQKAAKTVYRALGCSGLARVDMFLTEVGCVVLNEVNTMPGFTSYSRYPRMMAAVGLSLSHVIDHAVELALKGNHHE